MKKYILLLLVSVLVFSGCSKKEEADSEFNFNMDTYKIAEPYKESISGNYINGAIANNYDIDNVQTRLMELSTKYFKTTNYYYQAGQYLSSDKIKELLNKINTQDYIEMDGINLKPQYISYIHEQNYLDSSGSLAGISIGIVLNKYQTYQNSYGATLYKEIPEEELVQYAYEQMPNILTYLRQIDGLNNTRIIVGLYISSSPNSLLPGSYKYLGITSDNNISFHDIDYQFYYLDSNILMEKNIKIYDGFKDFCNQIDLKGIYISGYGLFYNNNLINASITVNSNYLNRDQLIFLEQKISEALLKGFDSDILFNVYIKVNNKIIGSVIKNKNTNKTFNYIFD